MLELGPHEQNIAKQALRSGQQLPERILNAPELEIGLELYIQAFFDLDTERNHTQGLVAIPWSTIANYAQAHNFDDEQRSDLFYHIKHLDKLHLERLDKKTPKPKK